MLFYNVSIEDFQGTNLGCLGLWKKMKWTELVDEIHPTALSKTACFSPGVISFACR